MILRSFGLVLMLRFAKVYMYVMWWIISRLVASSAKVEAQVQLLQRRCVQYGLQLTPFPQSTISRNLFLNPVSVYPSPIYVNM